MTASTTTSSIPSLTHALIAATVDSFYNGRARIVSAGPETPEHVRAIIAATVHTLFDGAARVVAVDPLHYPAWALEGRRDIFSSHRLPRGIRK